MARGLSAAIGELEEVDLEDLPVSQFAAYLAQFEKVRTQFEARAYELLSMFELSGAWQIDAAYNPANWLTAQTGVARKVAGSRMRLAGYLRRMPETREALSTGEITESHARVLSRCAANPRVCDAFAAEEETLVGWARDCGADELSNKIDAWIEIHDEDGPAPHDPEYDVVHANRVADRVKIDADLGLATGLPLLAALQERTDQIYRRDQQVAEINPDDGLGRRTAGNRRAEALVELIMAGSASASNPRHREPLLNVHVDEETFRFGHRHPDTLAELDDGTVVPIDILERWRCGARWETLVLDASRAVLFLGREQRYANREMRRSLAARDRGCAVPGCDRPPEQCDAHHVFWWEFGGLTDVDAMVLTCRHHHRMIHAGALTIQMVSGVPRFFDRDEKLLVEGRRRPQARAA